MPTLSASRPDSQRNPPKHAGNPQPNRHDIFEDPAFFLNGCKIFQSFCDESPCLLSNRSSLRKFSYHFWGKFLHEKGSACQQQNFRKASKEQQDGVCMSICPAQRSKIAIGSYGLWNSSIGFQQPWDRSYQHRTLHGHTCQCFSAWKLGQHTHNVPGYLQGIRRHSLWIGPCNCFVLQLCLHPRAPAGGQHPSSESGAHGKLHVCCEIAHKVSKRIQSLKPHPKKQHRTEDLGILASNAVSNFVVWSGKFSLVECQLHHEVLPKLVWAVTTPSEWTIFGNHALCCWHLILRFDQQLPNVSSWRWQLEPQFGSIIKMLDMGFRKMSPWLHHPSCRLDAQVAALVQGAQLDLAWLGQQKPSAMHSFGYHTVCDWRVRGKMRLVLFLASSSCSSHILPTSPNQDNSHQDWIWCLAELITQLMTHKLKELLSQLLSRPNSPWPQSRAQNKLWGVCRLVGC